MFLKHPKPGELGVLIAAMGLSVPVADLPGQEVTSEVPPPCEVRAGIPGGSDPEEDFAYNRCALDRGPDLLPGQPAIPQPLLGRSAGGSVQIVVEPDGSVDRRLTRPWTASSDTFFNRELLETIRRWHFAPGVKNGQPVRSGFTLYVKSALRNDTLPSVLDWEYRRGFNRDTLFGTWRVTGLPSPFTTPQLDQIYEALFRRLAEMHVVRSDLRASYCVIPLDADSARRARLARILDDLLEGGVYRPANVAQPGCERDVRSLRLVVPPIHRTENQRVVWFPRGDYLSRWPPGLDGRRWPSWQGRCVGVLVASDSARVECGVSPLIWDPDVGPRRSGNPLDWPRSDEDPIRIAAVATTHGAFTTDTLLGEVPEIRRLSKHAVSERHRRVCWRVRSRQAYSTQNSGSMYVLVTEREPASFRADVEIRGVRFSRAPSDFGGVTCPEEEAVDRFVAAFRLGDLGDAPSREITVCVDQPACRGAFVLDPTRDIMADSAHLVFRVGDLRPASRVSERLMFRIYLDRTIPDAQPLAIFRRGDRLSAHLLYGTGLDQWDYSVITGHDPDTEVRIYVLRMDYE